MSTPGSPGPTLTEIVTGPLDSVDVHATFASQPVATPAQPPLTIVLRLLSTSGPKSLPGSPRKSFDCLAATSHANIPATHGTSTTTVTVRDPPGGMARSRSSTRFPDTVTVPGPGSEAL